MRRIFGGAADGVSNSDSELRRLVNGATIPPYDELATHPYSAQIQFATQRIAALLDGNPQVVFEFVKQVKARIKCEVPEVSANSLCLLDASMLLNSTSQAHQLRALAAHKVLPRVCKMAQPRFNYPRVVAARARQVVLSWAHSFRTLSAHPYKTDFEVAAQLLGVAMQAVVAGHEGEAEENIPSAYARTAPPPPINPAVTGILTDPASAAANAAAARGSAPSLARSSQSSFYQSALRSAEREAAQLQAQRHALEQADRTAAFAVHQAPPTVMRPSSASSRYASLSCYCMRP